MNIYKTLPTIVIAGRANVGKSTFFNRIAENVRSMTYDVPGVTRDIVTDIVSWHGHLFRLIDTGGLSSTKGKSELEQEIKNRALKALQDADCTLFMIDGLVGILPEDREIAKLLRHMRAPVFLLVNKTDCAVAHEYMHEGATLGFPVFGISAAHGRGVDDLMQAIIHKIEVPVSSKSMTTPTGYRVAVIGKPNVGKSSLMNQLLQKDRTIVSEMAGSTREAISDTVTVYQQTLTLTDTPGMRRKRGVTEPLEQLMVKSALRAIDAAHVVLLVVDASHGTLSDQELKLAFYAFEEKHKSLIVVYNKQDLVSDEEVALREQQRSLYRQLLDKVATITVSCTTGKNIGKLTSLIHTVWERSGQRFSDVELTTFFNEQLTHKPLFKSGRSLEFYRAHQIKVAPITIKLVVGYPPHWERTQLNFFDNQLRTRYNLKGVAVVFVV